MNLSSPTRSPQHYLIMLPPTATPAEQEHVVHAAKELASSGYVYVASAHERTMEDRDNIRFMPLRSDALPRFGTLSTVMIVKDRAMVPAAERAYPQAKVLVFDAADSQHIVSYEQRGVKTAPPVAA
jgi:hypothetical protein